jgi:hypothetical protein
LAWAAGCGFLSTVRSLLSRDDTDPNAIDNNGLSILDIVCKQQKLFSYDGAYKEIESLLRDAIDRRARK